MYVYLVDFSVSVAGLLEVKLGVSDKAESQLFWDPQRGLIVSGGLGYS